ncbi:response regulator receiver domain-containing protein [Mucilaginibacter gracilis]|uniref:Response regulator receiver domain-containing protein n=1 Tax=Mucilaginibacter gracilis TaxID=423350 RepID=A0A495IVX1_9SPHI|nr:response regulator transcription factor [Mucilaginibacter gracilis]RKR80712.1 response regulator receiver domain-containing protein [Mucilaginibacter gracilis]
MDITTPITIAVVDDHALVREGMSNMLTTMGFQVVLQAVNGKDFLLQLDECPVLPDLCLLDINMPVMNGMETANVLKRQWPRIKILGYTFNNGEIPGMLASGADACWVKGNSSWELKTMILGLLAVG